MQKTTDESYVLIEHDLENNTSWAYLFKNKPTKEELALTILDEHCDYTIEDLSNKDEDEIFKIFYKEFKTSYGNLNKLLHGNYIPIFIGSYCYTLICVNHINNKGVIR